jgi:signal peptidase I
MKRRCAWILLAWFCLLGGCTDSNVSSGDRVLVSKLAYESGITTPQRFDVVVFKFPERPFEANTPKNFIKRLLGLPGEIIAIFFGNIFRFAPGPGEAPPYTDHSAPDAKLNDLWHQIRRDDPKSQQLFDEGRFEIVRKTPDVMLELRRIVYDNDHPAKDMLAYPRWAPKMGSGWKAEKQNSFSMAATKVESVDWLRYQHLIRPGAKDGPPAGKLDPQLITDFMGYNNFQLDNGGWEAPSPNWVGDLMVECQVEAAKSEGELWLELSKGIHRFQAKFDLGSGMCTLYQEVYRVSPDGNKSLRLEETIELDSKESRLRGPGTYLVRFANFDARLTVWVDKELPFGNGKDYPPPEIHNGVNERGPTRIPVKERRGPTRNDLEPASIGSKGAALKVSDIKLWRDTYYSLKAGLSDAKAGLSDASVQDFANPEKWDEFQNLKYTTLYVQPGHYLCMGDNSQASDDSRRWGLVPERLMLGRALLVYYPFHRVQAIR